MKFFTVVALFFFIAVVASAPPKEVRDEIKKAGEECQADPKYSLDTTILEKLKNHEKVEPSLIAKHALCINVKLGIQKENGDVNVDTLRKSLEKHIDDKDKVEKIINKCGVPASGTPEEAAIAFDKCMKPHHGPPPHN